MDAIILAGGIPAPDTALFTESGGKFKALIDIAGKPMAQWVLDALNGSERVANLILIGLDESAGLKSEKPVTYLPNGKDLFENIFNAVDHVRQHTPEKTHILLSTSDIPTITSEIVDWQIEVAQVVESDIDYFVVERQTMESRFPGSRRSFIRLRDVEVCGGDLHLIRIDIAQKSQFWERVIAARKNPLRQASLVGFDLLFLLLTRQMTLQDAEHRVSHRLGLRGRVIVSPYAEIAMDVDKAYQLEIIRKEFEAKAAGL